MVNLVNHSVKILVINIEQIINMYISRSCIASFSNAMFDVS